jgi:hypothetical protein
MTQNLQQVIESIQQLPINEQEQLLHWLEENRKPRPIEIDWQEKNKQFQKALEWIDQNRLKFLGKWVCLDGNKLIASGDDAKQVYAEAKAKGIKIPFIEQVRENEHSVFWGGLD